MIQSSKRSRVLKTTDPTKTHCLVVHHILGCCTEFLVALDDLINSIEKVLFCHRFPAGANGIHPGFCANAPYIRSWSNKQGYVRTSSSIKKSSSKTIKSHRKDAGDETTRQLTSRVGAEPCQKLETNISLAVHGTCMDLENLGTALQVR